MISINHIGCYYNSSLLLDQSQIFKVWTARNMNLKSRQILLYSTWVVEKDTFLASDVEHN